MYFKFESSRLFFSFLLFLSWMLLSLGYSVNINFGLQKLLHLFIAFFPIYWGICYLLKINSVERYKFLISLLGGTIMLLNLTALIISPFQFGTAYELQIDRWSHVVFSRITSIGFIVVFLGIHKYKINVRQKIFYLFVMIHFAALLAAGHRITLLSNFLFMIYYLIILKKEYKNFIYVLSAFISLFIIMLLLSAEVNERFYPLISNPIIALSGDGSSIARVEAWKVCWNIFLDNPLLGLGIGGFNGYQNLDITLMMKYPHNIFWEVLCELGLIGLSLFVYLFSQTIKFYSIKNKGVLTLIIFLLFLSLFAKDISSNVLLCALMIGNEREC